MKNLVTVIGIVFGAMLVVSQDAGAADTATPAGTATAGDIWSGCLAACQANYDEICEPAVIAAGNGKIGGAGRPDVRLRRAGVRQRLRRRLRDRPRPSLPQVCHDLGVH